MESLPQVFGSGDSAELDQANSQPGGEQAARPWGSRAHATSQSAHHPDTALPQGLVTAPSSWGAGGGGGPAWWQLCFLRSRFCGNPLLTNGWVQNGYQLEKIELGHPERGPKVQSRVELE